MFDQSFLHFCVPLTENIGLRLRLLLVVEKKVPNYYSGFSFCLLHDHQDRRTSLKKILLSHPQELGILDRRGGKTKRF